MSLCSPALFYLILSIFSIFIAFVNRVKITTILVKIIFISLWCWFLQFLCNMGHKTVAWFLVLLPFIMMLGMFVIAFEVLQQQQQRKH